MIKKEKYTYSTINSLALEPQKFVEASNAAYQRSVYEIAQRIFKDESKKIILLAGPSSSGKTTTAKLIARAVRSLGAECFTVSLDDFYYSHSEGKYPLDENGNPDYECVEALDLELMHKCLGELIENQRSSLPVFDFSVGERIENAREIVLSKNDMIVIEGIHALNPVISANLPSESLFKLYVSVSSRVYDDNSNVLLSKRDLRFIRRLIRDCRERAMTPDKTFDLWSRVLRGEDKYLFPFEYLADKKIDSFHPCEPCLLAAKAQELLSHSKEFAEKATALSCKLNLFVKIDNSFLPQESLLREFTGYF